MMMMMIIIIQFYYYFHYYHHQYKFVYSSIAHIILPGLFWHYRMLQASSNFNCNNANCRFSFLSRVFKIIYVFLYGTLVNLLFTLFIKIYVGQLRPHFLAVCKPNMSLINCSDGYITNYVCTGTDEAAIERARLVWNLYMQVNYYSPLKHIGKPLLN